MDGMPFGSRLIGQTEKALNAILTRHLADTGLTEAQWVTLTLLVNGERTGTADAFTAHAAGIRKVAPDDARARLGELTAAGHAHETPAGAVAATEQGKAEFARVRAATTEITGRLWGDLSEADLAAAGRVLNTVLARADDALQAA
ncbi:MarR family transcriptional regulator [Streptomyces sp. RFCAC02]|uniref:MarR family transcriptional regulator n=1 Tax=Streptomyces sp. RFCAC02 TaxID=2499143 RepID=UPI00101F2532|nr:MarR family transcriptional regulator [Streptomyces sp. RFCAC02]